MNIENNLSASAANTGASRLSFSYEFFPPRKVEQHRRFWHTVGCLETLSPAYFSVTYGALGTSQKESFSVIGNLMEEAATPVAAHLTCIRQSAEEIRRHLQELKLLGVNHIVALRGDAPANDEKGNAAETAEPSSSHLLFAEELVQLISDVGGFEISVAAYPETHPEAVNQRADLENLLRKFNAGATRALTQYFYDCDAFLRFRDQATKLGIEADAIVPGILPVHNIENVIAFSKRCGTRVPQALIDHFRKFANEPQKAREQAIAQCVTQCNLLAAEGIRDFHFYTLNQSDLAYQVTRELTGLTRAQQPVAA